MDEGTEPTPQDIAPQEPSEEERQTDEARKTELLKTANARFQQAYDAHKDDFEQCAKIQQFLAGDQWPGEIKKDRENQGRPCLTLDHLSQYVRHVINAGLMRARDVRVLPMNGEADDEVAEVLAGLVRQITQTSTAKVAYETGLRHATSNGFGYWRVKVQVIPGTTTEENPEGLQEIQVRRIKDPRMVLMDPFIEYPDGRDARYVFVLTKLTKGEFKEQYGEENADAVKSWHFVNGNTILPFISDDAVVVAEYYYFDGEEMKWAILTPDKVLDEGVHHGNVNPIIRVVGEEYEYEGKNRNRGMVNDSSMDAARAYNYSVSAFTESVALAPIAPFVAAAGQTEQFQTEWKDAHKTPRSVLRYKPVTISGQLAPPPQRLSPAGVPEGWSGLMASLVNDMQMIMGLAQPNVLGTGGIPVQSGAGIDAQKEPGDINTFHFVEHWHGAIEQTGRVILAMIPHVYTEPQAVKIVGEDGSLETAMLDPTQTETMREEQDSMGKVLSTSYNPMIGRYDVAISTGPASATKKNEANKMMMAMVQADPTLMQKAGDLVVGTMDMAGADTLSKRLKAFLPPGISDDDEAELLQKAQQLSQQNQALQQQVDELNQIVMGEREQSKAKLMEAEMQHRSDIVTNQQKAQADLLEERLKHQADIRTTTMKVQAELEANTQNNIVKIILEKIKAHSKIDIEVIKHFSAASLAASHEARMQQYGSVLESLNDEPAQPQPLGA